MSEVKVIFVINGQEHATTMSRFESVLEAALKARINPPYSCLEGICGTCAGFLEAGEVESVEGLVNEKSQERVFRTCQAQPRSDFLRVNYDLVST